MTGQKLLKTKTRFYYKSPNKSFNPNLRLKGLLHDPAKALVLPDAIFVKSFL